MRKKLPSFIWLAFWTSAAAFALFQPVSAQAGPGKAIELAPHRAVYELSLESTGAGSNVTDIRGQLVYDFSGSVCQGYTLTTRLVTEIFDREGKASTTDIRSRSFEEPGGGRFRFSTAQYVNEKLSESTKGLALRRRGNHDGVLVELEKPKRGAVALSGNIFFPTQHSMAILKAAELGQPRLQADIYDGSEKGIKVYETTTAIGAPLPADENAKLPAVKNVNALDGMTSWPVVVSYYDQSQKKDGLPSYEVSFRIYANGVSRKLKLDYGTFSLGGELSSIEFLPRKACP